MKSDWRIIFGFSLLLVIAVLALTIGLGKVSKDTSYGLDIVLGSLATLVGSFVQWAFSSRKDDNK